MKKLLAFVISWLALVRLGVAQGVPPETSDPQERELLALAEKLSRPSVAYKLAAIPQMLEEANYFSQRLKLPFSYPIRPADAEINVVGPWFSKIESTNATLSKADRIRSAVFTVAGVVQTTNFSFRFAAGKLWVIQNNQKHLERFDLYPSWAKTSSLITASEACHLATQWLASISIDVSSLERKRGFNIHQHFFWGNPENLSKNQWENRAPGETNKTMLPIYDVTSGEGDTPAVKVTILGTTEELLELRINDTSLSRRPPLIISNAMELNTRPGPAMKQLQ